MAISTVQTKSGNTAANYLNSTTLQWTGNVTAGNFLVLAIVTSNGSSTAVSSITDTSSNVWTKLQGTAANAPSVISFDFWYCKNCLGGTTPTITINMAVGQFNTISYTAREYNGVDATAPFDKDILVVEPIATFAQSHPSGNTATTTQADELVVAAYAYSNASDVLTVATGYTTVVNESNATQFSGMGFADKVVASTGAQNATFTSIGSLQGIVYVATFKQAGAPAPAGTTTLGFNYGSGNIVFGGSYDAAQVNADLTDFRRFCSHVRVSFPSYNANPQHITNAQNICLAAKALGFYVVWGITANGNTLTSSTYPTFKAAADVRAAWCKANGVDEFSYGNEEELRTDNTTLTYAQLRTNLRADGATAKSANPGLALTYSVDASSYPAWISEGIGSLDYFCMNNYGYNDAQNIYDYNTFQTKAAAVITAFGAKAYISEYNIYSTWSFVTNLSDQAIANEVGVKRNLLRTLTPSRTYFFTYANRTDDEFAAKLTNGNYRALMSVVVGQRAWFSGQPNTPLASRAVTPARAATPARGNTPNRGTL